MIGLVIAIVFFNIIAFKTNKKLSANLIVHIWTFSIAFQMLFDTFIEFKYLGYWYFDKEIDWEGVLPHLLVVPPVNMIFLNYFPSQVKMVRKVNYFIVFVMIILAYEWLTLLPKPWGYFHYGWWNLWLAALLDPILLLILLGYYKWVRFLENRVIVHKEK